MSLGGAPDDPAQQPKRVVRQRFGLVMSQQPAGVGARALAQGLLARVVPGFPNGASGNTARPGPSTSVV